MEHQKYNLDTLIILTLLLVISVGYTMYLDVKLNNSEKQLEFSRKVSFCQGISLNALTRYMLEPNSNKTYEEIRIERDDYAYNIYKKCLEDK